jgi:hypothetical protein
MILSVFLFCLTIVLISGDQFVYIDTNAEDIVGENLSQTPIPNVIVDIKTSMAYLSGSTDQIQLTFVGAFSVSGPHLVGPFIDGQEASITVTLERVIGKLQKVIMHKPGVDSYLLDEMKCRIGHTIYHMKGPRQWLDNLDPTTETAYPESEGYEALAQESMEDLPAATALTLDVAETQYYYTNTGIFKQ